MIKSPIQEVTNKFQHRAIGIVHGKYSPQSIDQFHKGVITDKKGNELETVVLGKALSLIKKYVSFEKNYFWIVYPKNKNTQNLHLQISGIWDPNQFNNIEDPSNEENPFDLLSGLNLNENYFSIRGELVYVNVKKKEFVIKICSSSNSSKLKKNNFKLLIAGELSLKNLNNFVSLDVSRDGNTLRLENYEIIEKSN